MDPDLLYQKVIVMQGFEPPHHHLLLKLLVVTVDPLRSSELNEADKAYRH